MFFNDDILFRNGSLAVVWLAGNGVLKNRNSRNKEVQRALKSRIIIICQDLRALFPRMGTAHGVPLKKMATLVKGAGTIYYMKIDKFFKGVSQTITSLNNPVILVEPQNDINEKLPKRKKKVSQTANPELPDPNGTVLGILPEHFGLIGSENDEPGFRTPRAVPCRSDSLDLQGLPHRLQMTPVRDNRDNLMVEAPLPLVPVEPAFEDLDFGDGMALLMDGRAGGDTQVAPPPTSHAEDDVQTFLPPPPSSTGLRSDMSMDSRSRAVMETPANAGTRTEDRRQQAMDSFTSGREQELHLEKIRMKVETPGRRNAGSTRRRLRLKIDAETNVSLRTMLDRIEQVNSEVSSESMFRELANTRPPPKSLWKFFSKKGSANIFTSCGRSAGLALTEMMDTTMEQQLRRPERTEYHDASIEGRRDMTGHTTGSLAISGLQDGVVPSRDMPLLDVDACMPQGPILGPVEPERQEVDMPPIPSSSLQENGQLEPIDGMAEGQLPFVPEQIEYQPPVRKRPRLDEHSNLWPRLDEHSNLFARLEGTQTFSSICPPQKVSKRRAAMTFFTVLKLQARKEVLLHQERPYAEIFIERLLGARNE